MNPRLIAVSGYGGGAQLIAVSGYGAAAIVGSSIGQGAFYRRRRRL